MPELSFPEWKNFMLGHPDAHLLQTGEWGELKSAFGWKAVRFVGSSAGAQVLFRRLPLGITVAYLPRGPVGSPDPAFWQELDQVCRQRKAVFLKVEPDVWETSTQPVGLFPGFRASPHSIQPPRTIVVDLQGTEDDLLARMKQKCRYNIRLAEKKAVTVRPWDDVDAFHHMMTTTGSRNEFGVHSLEYYHKAYALLHASGLGELLVAEYEGRLLAALMVCARGASAWYLYGASNDAERSRMPAYLLQWHAMRWARDRGARDYDLWGVPDFDEAELEASFEDRHEGLWGVYRFKRGFGGQLRRAAAAQDRVYRPLLYRAYLAFMRSRV